MPHIIVKLLPGRTVQQKTELANKIAENVVSIAGCKESSVSVSFEEVREEDWGEKVYRPDILNKKANLIKEPGYNPFE